jgi:secreted PhoX family phosphatase
MNYLILLQYYLTVKKQKEHSSNRRTPRSWGRMTLKFEDQNGQTKACPTWNIFTMCQVIHKQMQSPIH